MSKFTASAQAYPLTWPDTFPRKPAHSREGGTFRTTLNQALENVQASLRLFARDSGKKLEDIVISSNVTLGAQSPDDSGVAVWFTWDEMQVCIAVDRYSKVAANLQAIHHIIEARRVELRHGSLALIRATFQGFRALPSPNSKRSWRAVLGLPESGIVSRDDVEGNYKALAKVRHPDAKGGSKDAMAELNAARTDALKEV